MIEGTTWEWCVFVISGGISIWEIFRLRIYS